MPIAADKPCRNMYVRQNQQLQRRCLELEEQCRNAQAQAMETTVGEMKAGILEMTERVVNDHLKQNVEIKRLLAQPPELVVPFVERYPDLFSDYADRKRRERSLRDGVSPHSSFALPAHDLALQSPPLRTCARDDCGHTTPSGSSSSPKEPTPHIVVSERDGSTALTNHKAARPANLRTVSSPMGHLAGPPAFYLSWESRDDLRGGSKRRI